MEEIIGNVIENSCKWADKKVRLEISTINNEEIKIIFADDGPGLPQDKMKKFLLEVLDLMNKLLVLAWVLI